ncbi:MAG TPA: dTDP-4-dehydrorhamnose 3,5-epimerase family protein [Methylomirabilota bacterium]|nr:dTDP-4-dehydrorhamnose 3,5-epimerase family protein [Methylomirabilota bacterium]
MIAGVERRALEPHTDARGTLREVWRSSQRAIDVRQVLVTVSLPNALRGMHYHLRQTDLVFVTSGRVSMALIDLRDDVAAKHQFVFGEGESLLIPPGVAHGYATERGATTCYLLTTEVDGSDEFGFRFDDPEAALAWPTATPTLSPRDRDAGALATALAHVRRSFAA